MFVMLPDVENDSQPGKLLIKLTLVFCTNTWKHQSPKQPNHTQLSHWLLSVDERASGRTCSLCL